MNYSKLKLSLINYYLNELNIISVEGIGYIRFRLLMGSLPTESQIAAISILSQKNVEKISCYSEIKA